MHRLSDDVAAIEVTVPHHYRWTPGQHCFLRFPGFAPLDNHPFTISSIPATVIADDEKAVLRPNTLKFLIRSYSGFTARLLQPVESNATACPQALVDGPYGGLARVVERSYDSVIGVAGGLGITAILPWIEHLARKMEMEPGRTATQQVHLIWMVKRRAQLSYLHAELLRIQSVFLARPSPITYELYVTAEHGDSAATPSAGDEKDGGALRPDGLAQSVHYGRPDLRSLVPSRVSQPRTYVLDRWRDAFMNPPCYLAR